MARLGSRRQVTVVRHRSEVGLKPAARSGLLEDAALVASVLARFHR